VSRKRLLLCGATGFIGRNLLNHFAETNEYELYAVSHLKGPTQASVNDQNVKWIKADLRNPQDVEKLVANKDVVIQAAATTSGAKEIVNKPYTHVTDNAVMSSYLFRACFERQVKHVVFFSCSVIYPASEDPVKECDFNYQIEDKYFGAGWTKVYLEKMCEFYSRLGASKYTVIRHSNIYGPYDKYDLERSHVFGATVTKVMTAPQNGKIVVWGDGSETRDLLYVGDLVKFVARVLEVQECRHELINIGSGTAIAVGDLVSKIIRQSGKSISVEFDKSKPTIPFKLALNIDRARDVYGWSPRVSLEDGIQRTLSWYKQSSEVMNEV